MTDTEYRYYTRGDMIYLLEIPVVRRTPAGRWVKDVDAHRYRFVLSHASKQWCWPTKELALKSVVRRKERQVGILTAQLEDAKAALKHANASTPESLLPQCSRIVDWQLQ